MTAQRVSNLAGAVFTNTFTSSVTSGSFQDHGFVETMTALSLQIAACALAGGSVCSLGAVHLHPPVVHAAQPDGLVLLATDSGHGSGAGEEFVEGFG
ncbi:hypothetical protein [Streptomyces broussonetiae]|uniref:Uncharacterized protein n=1 Tax=Streptomyces broussonetiae TaxID=2686304 RepID=A0ABV5EMB0_9ACTN